MTSLYDALETLTKAYLEKIKEIIKKDSNKSDHYIDLNNYSTKSNYKAMNNIFSPIDDHLLALKYQCDKFMAEHKHKEVEE